MSRKLIEAGHSVSMICGVNSATEHVLEHSERVNEFEVDGIRVHCIAERYANKMGFFRRLWAFGAFARTAARVVGDLKADLVFATSTPLSVGIPGMKGARRLRVPFVFEVRDLWPEVPIAIGVLKSRPLIWYSKRLERQIYRAAQRIIALSPGMKEGIARTGFPSDKITMVPNGCDLDLFLPDDAPLDDARFGDKDDFRLVFCGAHGLANGLDAVLDAAAVLRKRGVRGIKFVFIGDGGQRERLMERARSEKLDELTVWVKFIPKIELARILPRMEVGLMILRNLPAFYFGTSPNKFFDYIASGIPVLNNYPGWVAGMIEEHQCGRVVPPDDPEAFADAVLALRERRGELPAMGRNGRKLAEAEFGREKLGARFVETLEQAQREFRS